TALRDLAHDRRRDEVDPEEIARYNASRRSLLRTLGISGAGLAGRGLFAGGIGTALATLIARPAAADKNLDIQILQTASSLEVLAVATYDAALTLPFIKDGNKTVVAFAQTTRKQHDEHRKAFQDQTKALGGTVQEAPNPKFVPVVEAAKPKLKTALDVATLAETLETVATETYLVNCSLLADTDSRALMASVMGVETQHAATLRAVKALLSANAPDLIAIDPAVVAKLPAAAGSVAFPEPFESDAAAAAPETGAVK
ncbi:MAG TPA: ferritin-like domain-containing protein, partial [Acidimicrobiales bacterium]|nr:ferritin-like domain-containing protein [Acidimicrobiales bacterium]